MVDFYFFFSLSFSVIINRLLYKKRKTSLLHNHIVEQEAHTLKNHGESTRGVLLGARMAVREEEQRVRPRVREPNAHVRGERQRDREARI